MLPWLKRIFGFAKPQSGEPPTAKPAPSLEELVEHSDAKLRQGRLLVAKALDAEVVAPLRPGGYVFEQLRDSRRSQNWNNYAALLESHANELTTAGFPHRALRAYRAAAEVRRNRLNGRGSGCVVLQHLAALLAAEPLSTLRAAADPLFQYCDPTLELLFRGRIEARLGNLPEAERLYSAYLDALPSDGVESARWLGTMELVEVLAGQQKSEEATRHARSAFALAEEALDAASASERASLRQCVAQSVELYLSISAANVSDAAAALNVAEHARARAFLDDAKILAAEQPEGLPEHFRSEERSLLRMLRISRWYLRTAAPQDRQQYASSDDFLRSDLNDFLDSLPDEWQWYAQIRRGKPVPVELSLARLHQHDPSARIIVYHWGRSKVLRWSCAGGRIEDFRPLACDADELAAKCEAFRQACMTPAALPDGLAGELGSLILPELSPGSSETVCIVPSGPLWAVPFHCLEQRGLSLGQDFSFATLPVISSAMFWPEGPPVRVISSAAVVGDSRNDLPHARKEAKSVAAMFDISPLLGTDVIRFLLEPEMAKSQLWHAACHAVFDEDVPDQSGIYLGDGTIMSAQEISALEQKCDLCVLSCCETARMTGRNVDDPYGVGLAFLRSGVGSVVDALWKIDDESSSLFMREFYSTLLNGPSLIQALHAARRAVRSDAKFRHPYFWAPYQLAGMWNVTFRR